MQFYRLIKPDWAQQKLANGEPNPDFKENINGPNIIEGAGFSADFLNQKNQEGYSIFFFPNHPSSDVYSQGIKHLNGKSIDVFNFVFVDMDLKDKVYASKEDFYKKLAEFPLAPTMVVSSGHGVHAYWRIKDLTRDSFVISQMALLKHFNTDTSVWTVLQLMRAPGFLNTKRYKEYVPAELVADLSSNQTYSFDQIPKEIFGLIDEETQVKARNHLNRLEGKMDIDFGKDVNFEELPEKFLDLMDRRQDVRGIFEDPRGTVGDRSSADMKLANILFSEKFDIREALAVISNTQKALEKGAHRMEYAQLTVSKVYNDRPKHKFKTVSEYLSEDSSKVSEPQILGPHYLDYGVLGEPWRRKELLGIIAGAGVGKTAKALNIIKEIINNNPHNDDVFVFFSLEMSKGQIIKRWIQLVGEDSKLTDRLYVIDRINEETKLPVNIGLQEIYEYCSEIKQCTGKHIGAIVIDHFHIISTHINIHKKPSFGIDSEQNTGYGDNRNLSLNGLATQLKSLIQALDTFGILLSQTTKEKGIGDLPLGKDAAYGVSQYEWIVDRIITIWQPLMRVQNLSQKRFLAYQYAKIREKRPNDKIHECDPKLLTYDMYTGKLEIPTTDEYQHFIELLPQANLAREAAIKKQGTAYSIQVDLSSVDTMMKDLGVKK